MEGLKNIHDITRLFEAELCKYTGAPYCVCVDNQSNGLYLSLVYENIKGKEITIPARTYMSVPCEIKNAGGKVKFAPVEGMTLKGAYQLAPTRVWDSALRFTADMYMPNTIMCLSFTGPYKHFKLVKGGAVLTDDENFYKWLKKAINSGRGEVSYHLDEFTMTGKNHYMMPMTACIGLHLMPQFYNFDGSKKYNEDLELPYPDLSKFPIYTADEELTDNR